MNPLIIRVADENPLDRGSPHVLHGMMYTGAIYLHIFFKIIRRRRSTVSYAAARAHRARIMLTMPLRFALLRVVEVSYFLFPLPRRARSPMIVERGSERDGDQGNGKERRAVKKRRRLLENCSHNSSRDRYYYRTR